MKESQLREHATCSLCKNKIGASGIPMFWVVSIERFGLDAGACQRQQGLGMQIGATLAKVMGPDEDLAIPVMDKLTLTVCEKCAIESRLPVAVLAESGDD